MTPGRQLLLNLKPVGASRSSKKPQVHRQSKLVNESTESTDDYTNHFKNFMDPTPSVKRARSFSQPRKDAEAKKAHFLTSRIGASKS